MVTIPDTVYARDGDVHLAYQIVGDPGPDLLFVPTGTFPIDLLCRGAISPLALGSGITLTAAAIG